MNILLIGSGAREHAIARAIKRSPQRTALFCFGSSQNPGIAELTSGYTVGALDDAPAIARYAKAQAINWAIIGPEQPLEAGVVDALKNMGIEAVGPSKSLAQIESSKSFTRQLLVDYRIPAYPRFQHFSGMTGVREFMTELDGEYVVKADGLMGGKGVKVSGEHLHSLDEGVEWCEEILKAGQTFLIEEKLIGQEFSLMSFCDGTHLAHMPSVQDHKRAYDGDTGPNTGGMGSYSDANHQLPFLTKQDIMDAQAVTEAVAQALKDRCGQPYLGILYGGFMATADGVKLIEYNARFGDPEVMNVLALLETDFVALCESMIREQLDPTQVRFRSQATVCKYAVPHGYPDAPVKGQPIDISGVQDPTRLYFGGVNVTVTGLEETGSRTIAVVGMGDTIGEAEAVAEAEVNRIQGHLFHRRDIGTAALIAKRIAMIQALRS